MAPQYTYKYQQLGTHLKTNRKLQGIVGAGFIFFLFAGIWAWTPRHYHTSSEEKDTSAVSVPAIAAGKGWKGGRPAYTFADGTTYEKPPEIKIHALLFYGRWDRMQVLDCYLRVSAFGMSAREEADAKDRKILSRMVDSWIRSCLCPIRQMSMISRRSRRFWRVSQRGMFVDIR